MFRFVTAAAVGVLMAGSAHALSVDFESYGGADPTNLGTSFSFGGIDFSSTENMTMVGTGGSPPDGFVPNDSPVPSDGFGNWFITGDFLGNTDMTLSFASALTSISFDIADIDGGSSDSILDQNNDESFTFSFYLGGTGGTLVDSITKTTNDVAGDGTITNISFASGLFDTVQIVGTTPGGSRNIGWGLDNIEASVVPLPAGVWMLLTGLAGMVALRRRKAASA